MNHIIIGIDVGIQGGISVLKNNKLPEVFKMPLKKIVVNKKNRNVYDIEKIVSIFKKYKDKNVLFCIERQGVRPGEGAVGAMTIGKGFGQLLGVACALGFKIKVISSITWKKQFLKLNTKSIMKKKEERKKIRAFGKTLKEKAKKKENKKKVDKLRREIKKEAKTAARELAAELYPDLSDRFEKKNTDGVAESLLIALYGKANENELVQDI